MRHNKGFSTLCDLSYSEMLSVVHVGEVCLPLLDLGQYQDLPCASRLPSWNTVSPRVGAEC